MNNHEQGAEDLIRALFDGKQAEDLRHLRATNRILVGDGVTHTTAEFSTVAEAMGQAAYLMSLGHDVRMERGGL